MEYTINHTRFDYALYQTMGAKHEVTITGSQKQTKLKSVLQLSYFYFG